MKSFNNGNNNKFPFDEKLKFKHVDILSEEV